MMKGMWWRLHYLVCCYHRVIFGGGDYITWYVVTIELYLVVEITLLAMLLP